MKKGITPADIQFLPGIRFSSKRQKFGYSEVRQEEELREHCTSKGYCYNDTFEITDKGKSGYYGKNFLSDSQLGKFMDAAREGLAPENSLLGFTRVNRFTREVLSLAEDMFREILKLGIDIVILEPYMYFTLADWDNEDKRTQLIKEMGRARRESAEKSDLIGDAVSRNVQAAVQNLEGMKPLLPGHYHAWLDWTPTPKTKNRGTYSLNDDHLKIVRAVDLYLDEEQTPTAIAKLLTREEVPTLKGAQFWRDSSLLSVFRNTALKGQLVFKLRRGKPNEQTIVVDNFFPKAISEARWNELQARLEANAGRKTANMTKNVNNLFPAHLHCVCGSTAFVGLNNAKTPAMMCLSHRIGRPCCKPPISMRADMVEVAFFTRFLGKFPQSVTSKTDNSTLSRIEELKSQVSRHSKKLSELMNMDSDVGAEERQKVIAERDLQKKLAEREITRLTNELTSRNMALAAFEDIMKEFHAGTSINDQKEFNLDATEVTRQLRDQPLRRTLSSKLFKIVDGLVIDTNKRQFAVRLLDKSQTAWINVGAAIDYAYAKERKESYTPERRKRMSEVQFKRWAAQRVNKHGKLFVNGKEMGRIGRKSPWSQYDRARQRRYMRARWANMTPEQRKAYGAYVWQVRRENKAKRVAEAQKAHIEAKAASKAANSASSK